MPFHCGRRACRPYALAAWLAAAAGAQAAGWAEPPVPGLVVRLTDATAHDRGGADSVARASLDAPQWRHLLGAAALSGTSGQREPVLRATGRDLVWLDFGRGLSADEAARLAERLRRQPGVDWVAPNVRESPLQAPTDPLAGQQWWLQPVSGSNQNAIAQRLRGVPGFLRAWQSGLLGADAGPGAVVAVLDTGITPHPDLQGRILPGFDFVSDVAFANDGDSRDDDPTDPGDGVSAADQADSRFAGCEEKKSSWHGTVIAGLIAAVPDNGIGVAGLHPRGRVLPVRVAGKCGAAVVDIIDGMRWAAGLQVARLPLNPFPARIINISFGGPAPCGREYQDTINELRSVKGAVVVAAAGNEHGAPSRPANCGGAVGVVALNRDGFKTHYSNFGPELAAGGLATVGGDDNRAGLWAPLLADSGLVTVWNTGVQQAGRADYAALTGTSFAAPLVAGTMSLMLDINPALSARQLVDGVRLTARPHVTSPRIGHCAESNPGRCICTTASCGAGILDAEQALRYAAYPGSYVAPARQPEVMDNTEVAQASALGSDRPANAVVLVQAPAASGGGGAVGAGWPAALVLASLLLAGPRAARSSRTALSGPGKA